MGDILKGLLVILIFIGLTVLYVTCIKTGIRVLFGVQMTNPQVIWLIVLKTLLFPSINNKSID